MSVVIYKKDGNKLTIAADRQVSCQDNGFIGETEKLFKLSNGIIIGCCGSSCMLNLFTEHFSSFSVDNFNMTIGKTEELIRSIKRLLDKQPESLIKKSNYFIIIINKKIYYVYINDKGELSNVNDISDRSLFGIGLYEMPMGAILMGATPKEAIGVCQEYNMYYGKGITCFEIEL